MDFKNGDKLIVYDDTMWKEFYYTVFHEDATCEECTRKGGFIMEDDTTNRIALCMTHMLKSWTLVQIVPKNIS